MAYRPPGAKSGNETVNEIHELDIVAVLVLLAASVTDLLFTKHGIFVLC